MHVLLLQAGDKQSKIFEQLDKKMAGIQANSSSISVVLATPTVLQYEKGAVAKAVMVLGWVALFVGAGVTLVVAAPLALPATLAGGFIEGAVMGAAFDIGGIAAVQAAGKSGCEQHL